MHMRYERKIDDLKTGKLTIRAPSCEYRSRGCAVVNPELLGKGLVGGKVPPLLEVSA
jgi:hypothetical protein